MLASCPTLTAAWQHLAPDKAKEGLVVLVPPASATLASPTLLAAGGRSPLPPSVRHRADRLMAG